MGKRIPLDTVYRRPAETGKIKAYKLSDPLPDELLKGLSLTNKGIAALARLEELRAKKAASQRKWRANRAKKAGKT